MKFHGATNNLDYALKNGIWLYDTSTTNRPDANGYGICLVLNNGVDSYAGYGWFFQLAFGTTDGGIYTRKSINATDVGGFSQWVRIL